MAAQELYTTSLFNDANLKNYYRLEDATDSKGAVNLTNENSVTFTAAQFGNGANLGSANTNKALSTTNTLGIDGGAITLHCWVKLNAEIASGLWTFGQQINNTSQTRNEIFYSFNGGTIQVLAGRTRMGVVNNWVSKNGALGTSTFHMIDMTYDGSTVTLYVDGISAGTTGSSGNGSSTDTAGFCIGRNTNSSQFASATIDDFAVFNRALTATEISNLYNGFPVAGRFKPYAFIM